MTPPPSRKTAAGAVYLDLQRIARSTSRPVAELFQLYALEGFLRRLIESRYADNFVLKGGVLLAAYTDRRPTRDIDFAAEGLDADLDNIESVVIEILKIPVDDGLQYSSVVKAESIRDDAESLGARVSIDGTHATARIRFHVDINIGDPLWPAPGLVDLPQIRDEAAPIVVLGYSPELVLAEKIVTAIQRGIANTRWRDFVDIAALADSEPDVTRLSGAIQRVAAYRDTTVQPLADVLDGFAEVAQPRWAAWRTRQQLDNAPVEFADLLDAVVAFADPVLNGLAAER